MDNDDALVGRILSRREAMAALGAAGAALLYDPSSLAARHLRWPACVARPEQMEGPYFADVMLNRSDIRLEPSDGKMSEGSLLDLTFQVSRITGTSCTPLKNALVDLWQCDAHGIYSSFQDARGLFDTVGKKFLRGHQITDATGVARFTTIYPGWYPGRTVHLHFKIRTDAGEAKGYEFTSQLYFDDALTDRVFTKAPYDKHTGDRRRNEGDGIYRRGGSELMLDVAAHDDGYAATFDIGLQLP